jgi:hypothetical protein
MKKALVVIGGLALAGCGAGTVAVVQNIYDQIQNAANIACQLRPTFATIDALIKALGGPPVVDVIAGLFCTQARTLQVQQAPKATLTPDGVAAVDLGVVIINGKPVRIQVLR